MGQVEKEKDVIDAPLKKDEENNTVRVSKNGKTAKTVYKLIKKYDEYSLLDVTLLTGRTHQIRVHMAYINHPVVNDPVYGYNKLDNKDFGQMLHAFEIGFVHPVTHKFMDFKVNPPEEFYKILEIYKNR